MIVNRSVYRQGRREDCGDLADTLAALRAPGSCDEDFLWVGLTDPSQEEFDLVVRELDLHPLAVEDARAGDQRAKIETSGEAPGSVFAVVKTVRYVEATSDIETGEVVVILAPHIAVTLGWGEVAPLIDLRNRLEQHEQELLRRGPVSVLHGVLDTVVDSYVEIDEEVARDLTEIEADVFGGGNRTHSTTIYRLKREVLEFRRAASPLRLPLQALADDDGPVGDHEMRLHLRDVSDHLQEVISDIDSFDALLSDVLAAHLSQIGVQQNSDMRQISAWAAMIAVPTLIAGIYGMNFAHMPELRWTVGYPLVLLVMAVAVGLLHRSFRRSGWL